eukprot:3421728-Amphidinium_carterae.1
MAAVQEWSNSCTSGSSAVQSRTGNYSICCSTVNSFDLLAGRSRDCGSPGQSQEEGAGSKGRRESPDGEASSLQIELRTVQPRKSW